MTLSWSSLGLAVEALTGCSVSSALLTSIRDYNQRRSELLKRSDKVRKWGSALDNYRARFVAACTIIIVIFSLAGHFFPMPTPNAATVLERVLAAAKERELAAPTLGSQCMERLLFANYGRKSGRFEVSAHLLRINVKERKGLQLPSDISLQG